MARIRGPGGAGPPASAWRASSATGKQTPSKAALGIYGLISYLVAQRTREFGIRLALGAEARDVMRLVVGKGLLCGDWHGRRHRRRPHLDAVPRRMLFGLSPTDPIAFGAVLALTLSTVIVATYAPARRAMKVAPAIALRAE